MLNSQVEQIKERLDIVDVISNYVELKKAGSSFKGLSPFSSEKTPSFYVSPDEGLFYCFSSGKGGDIFTFVQEIEGLDFKGALKLLAEQAGVDLTPVAPEKQERKDKLYLALEMTALYFQEKLSESNEAKEYLKKRGIEDKTIKHFRIGFVPDEWRGLYEFLLKKGLSEDIIYSAGLVKRNDGRVYDSFRDRIMFPIQDTTGRVIAFTGRRFDESKDVAKYINSPDTELFNKSEILFGIDKAKSSIRKYDFSILVEGQVDVIMLHQAGFINTVAASGTALSDKTSSEDDRVTNIGLVKRLSKNIILAYDSDSAGIKAALRAALIALKLGMDAKIIELPEGKDPADLLLEEGKDVWSSRLRESVSIVEFMTKRIVKKFENPKDVAKNIHKNILPFLAQVPSAIDRVSYISIVSKLSGLPADAIKEDLEKLIEKNPQVIEKAELTSAKKIQESREEYILGLYLMHKNKKIPDDFKSSVYEEIFDDILGESWKVYVENKYSHTKSVSSIKLKARLDDLGNIKNKHNEIQELVVGYLIDVTNQRISKSKKLLVQAEQENNTSKINELLNNIQKYLDQRKIISLLKIF